MKRLLLLLVLLFSFLGVVGCIDKSELYKSEVDKATSTPAKPIKENRLNENSNVSKKDEIQSENIDKTENDDQDLLEFIPKGWHILKKYDDKLAIADGDLNRDGIIDKAFVIEESIKGAENTEYALDSPRNLIILFGHKNNTYKLAIKADKAILLGGEGGGFGDPFDDLIIERGSVLLKFFGGSSRWYKYYRFRYQNNGWYLIGYTEGSYVSNGTEMFVLEEDYNLLTGDYIIETLENDTIKTIKGNRGNRQLMNLQDFNADEDDKSQF